ncbi:MAG: hypothetical protein ACREP9_01120 [Candidatus Dormibacteraceae bacterium]
MGSLRQIRDDIDLAQGRLMQADEVALLEGFGLLGAGEEVARLNLVPCQKVLEHDCTSLKKDFWWTW